MTIDTRELLSRIMNMDNTESFDPAVASLQALGLLITSIGGAMGAGIIGVCDTGMAASTTQLDCGNLAGIYPDDIFESGYEAIHLFNADVPRAAPEMEKRPVVNFNGTTGRVTVQAFSAVAEGDDVILLLPKHISSRIVAVGRCDSIPNTVTLTDARRTEANDHFNGHLLTIFDTQADMGQTRVITDQVLATNSLTLHPALEAAAVGLDLFYVIWADKVDPVPAADEVRNEFAFDAIGSKASTPVYAATNTADVYRYLKAMLGTSIIASGTLTVSSATEPVDAARTEANDHFKGCRIMTLTGTVALQPRPIGRFAAGGTFYLDEPFTALPGTVAYVILEGDYPYQRLLDILNTVLAQLELNETGTTLTTDGTVQNIYINNAPAGALEPKALKLDTTNMQAGDQIRLRSNYRVVPGGNLIKQGEIVLSGAQDPALKLIELEANRHGYSITIERLAGTDRTYGWGIMYAD